MNQGRGPSYFLAPKKESTDMSRNEKQLCLSRYIADFLQWKRFWIKDFCFIKSPSVPHATLPNAFSSAFHLCLRLELLNIKVLIFLKNLWLHKRQMKTTKLEDINGVSMQQVLFISSCFFPFSSSYLPQKQSSLLFIFLLNSSNP